MKKVLSRIYLAFIFILLYAPILVLIILSFNDSKTRAKWGGWTLKWYQQMLLNADIMAAFRNTLVIALLSALISTLLGLLAAIGLNTSITDFKKAGLKPMFYGITIDTLVTLTALVVIWCMGLM